MLKCNACSRQVIPMKAFSWPWFLMWLLLTGVGGVLYLIYYLTKTPRVCPACSSDVYDGFLPHSPQAGASGIVFTEDLPESADLRGYGT